MAFRRAGFYTRVVADAGRRKPRHVAGAFALGAAISTAALAGGAIARGPFIAASPTLFAIGGSGPVTYSFVPLAPPVVRARDNRAREERARDERDDDRPRRRIVAVARVSRPRTGLGEPVCVRLCDGYFFPLPAAAGDAGADVAAC